MPAMFDFAHRFPNERYKLSKLWPDMHLPVYFNAESIVIATDFPVQHLHAAGAYARIISKHGGVVHVPCSKNVFNYLGAFPDVLSVCPGDDFSISGWAQFLCTLANAKKRIRSCILDPEPEPDKWVEVAVQLTRLPIQSLIWPEEGDLPNEIWDALPDISGLSYLEINLPEDNQENNSLPQCLDLKEIAFIRLPSDASESLVVDMLELVRGSCIQKVWSELPSLWTYVDAEEELEIFSSAFLKHDWHMVDHNDDDSKVCFVYRHS